MLLLVGMGDTQWELQRRPPRNALEPTNHNEQCLGQGGRRPRPLHGMGTFELLRLYHMARSRRFILLCAASYSCVPLPKVPVREGWFSTKWDLCTLHQQTPAARLTSKLKSNPTHPMYSLNGPSTTRGHATPVPTPPAGNTRSAVRSAREIGDATTRSS
jgi:hypothetical protein